MTTVRSLLVKYLYKKYRLYYAIWSEIRSLRGRISVLRTKRLHVVGVDFGAAMEENASGVFQQNGRTVARIRDTRELSSALPEASLVDYEIYLKGWDMGAKWVSQ